MPTLAVTSISLPATWSGRRNGFDQSIHEGHDVAEIGDVDEGDGEFVAAQPRDEVVLAQRRLNAGADVAQNLVAAAMVGGFVDLLEIVDVETKHGDMVRSRCMRAIGLGQAIAESLAIGEAGQGVVLLEIAELAPRLSRRSRPRIQRSAAGTAMPAPRRAT